MKRIKSIVCGTVGALGLLAMTSCTDLTETIYSDLTKDNYYTDKASVEAAVVRCFEHSDNVTWRGDIWKLQELTADHFVSVYQPGEYRIARLQYVRFQFDRCDR